MLPAADATTVIAKTASKLLKYHIKKQVLIHIAICKFKYYYRDLDRIGAMGT